MPAQAARGCSGNLGFKKPTESNWVPDQHLLYPKTNWLGALAIGKHVTRIAIVNTAGTSRTSFVHCVGRLTPRSIGCSIALIYLTCVINTHRYLRSCLNAHKPSGISGFVPQNGLVGC